MACGPLTFGLVGPWSIEPVNHWTVLPLGLLYLWAIGLVGPLAVRPFDHWTVVALDHRTVVSFGSLGQWTVLYICGFVHLGNWSFGHVGS